MRSSSAAFRPRSSSRTSTCISTCLLPQLPLSSPFLPYHSYCCIFLPLLPAPRSSYAAFNPHSNNLTTAFISTHLLPLSLPSRHYFLLSQCTYASTTIVSATQLSCSPSTITASSSVVVDSASSSHACCLSPLAIVVLPQSCTTTTATAHSIVVLPCRNPRFYRLVLLPPRLSLQLHLASSAIAAGTPICRLQPHPTMPSFVAALPPTTALPLLPPIATHIPRLSLTITIATLSHHLIVVVAINLKITAAPTHPLTAIAAINLHHLQSTYEAY
ncbi:hypothetical protein BHE74_00050907 [Ensete ventricosum]|uniref:Uncharacterized protein n=1 Tax=Ensete ventricosum TaxID=4639 RepID=A0A445MJE0_ENSVE|nr:hypothetical protein BHE74_00050907 [Ensete ventricosum]RZR74231.1 hypothetical protein BHM03_00034126 [Ensete ventricosum]